MSDVGLITPLRDGMNLVAKEYVACQIQNPGVLILSEMAGAADELHEALIINPYDQKETAQAIKEAPEMPAGIKQEKIKMMQKKVRQNNVVRWASSIFKQTVTSH
jgi:trehalose 6-phosphate synthase/phosphatase